MSAFQDLASPAPKVEAAKADRAFSSGAVKVEPAVPVENAIVEPVRGVGPAVLDEHKKFSPAISKEAASHLSVSALRGSGADFECKVSRENLDPFSEFGHDRYPLLMIIHSLGRSDSRCCAKKFFEAMSTNPL